MTATLETPRSLAARLREMKTAVVATHISPDSDALGSAFALKLALKSIGVDCQVHIPEPLPERFTEILKNFQFRNDVPESFDALIAVDCANRPRLGAHVEALFANAAHTFVIDHHISNIGYATYNWIDGSVSSASEMVLQVVKELGVKLTPEISSLLFMGLADDTGGFRFASVTAETFFRAAELVQGGARPSVIAKSLSFGQPLEVVRLRAKALSKIEQSADGRISWITVPRTLLEETGTRSEHTEGLVDDARGIRGTEAAFLLREIETGRWKLSLRSSNEKFDSNAVCGLFGGGGHRGASGATIEGTLDEILPRLLQAITEYLPERSA